MIRILLLLVRVAVPVAIAYGLWLLVRPKWAFRIVADESGVRSHDGITTPQQRRLLDLFYRMRFVEGRVTVLGRHDENGSLKLQFRGRISEDAKQQIRNFIINEL